MKNYITSFLILLLFNFARGQNLAPKQKDCNYIVQLINDKSFTITLPEASKTLATLYRLDVEYEVDKYYSKELKTFEWFLPWTLAYGNYKLVLQTIDNGGKGGSVYEFLFDVTETSE